MDVRMLAAVTGGTLEGVNVRALCRQVGVAPKTFYKWRARYRAEGQSGLEPRSRRPARSPRRTSSPVEDAIVELRKRLNDEGLDAGAATIRWHLGHGTKVRPPSEATIWRILRRRGFVTVQPQKRPKSALRRFEARWPNECWQLDATEWVLLHGEVVEILNLLDDHSRVAIGARALARVTSETAWETFSQAAAQWGLPARCLSDNGLAFTGRLRGFEVFFETQLRAAGVTKVNARPYHPQTCGKVERYQQTLKKWLAARRPRPATLDELQTALERFRSYYNHERPHRGIGRITPIERFQANPPARPGTPLPAPQRHVQAHVNRNGVVEVGPFGIGIGIEHAGRPADVTLDQTHATVLVDGRLVRHLELDHTRRYQPSGRAPGQPRRRRPD